MHKGVDLKGHGFFASALSELQVLTDKRPFLTFFLGLLCFFTSPPFFFFPFLATFPLVWWLALEDKVLFSAIKKLFWFLCGYFLSIFNWFFVPIISEIRYWALIPLCLFFMPAILASVAMAFQAPCLILAKRSRWKIGAYFLMSIGWSCFEFFKSHYFLSGLPLQNVGMIVSGNLCMIQIANILTQSQLDTVVTFILFVPYFWIAGDRNWKLYGLLATLLIATNWFYGNKRVGAFKKAEKHQDYHYQFHVDNIVGVQGNVSQKLIISGSEKFADRIKILQTYYNFSQQHTKKNPNADAIVVWPEGAVLFYDSEDDASFLNELATLIPGRGIMMFPSIVAIRPKTALGKKFYNTTTVIGPDGEVHGMFSKRHLVPFGEYIPFRSFIPSFIQTIAGIANLGDLSNGESNVSFILHNNISIMPTICYDSFFDDIYVDKHGNKPDIIINMTNTGWVGNSIGFSQHFFATRMRAVRNKRALLNIANNQGSVFINEIGMFVKYLPNKEMDAIRICVFSDKPHFSYDRSRGKLFKFREC